jgi:organic hydroperoxide reductase OsmC/OhrA
MAVIASRQPAYHPETIRTRLARFMPKAAAAAWSVAWSAHTERPGEIGSEDELAAAEHLGCFGAALSHALAAAEIAPSRLGLLADSQASLDGSPQPITVEVHGPALDASVIETVARRTETMCPVWKGLASEGRVRIIGIIEDDTAGQEPAQTSVGTTSHSRQPQVTSQTSTSMPVCLPSLHIGSLPRVGMPRWLTPRMGILLAVAGAFVVVPHLLPG